MPSKKVFPLIILFVLVGAILSVGCGGGSSASPAATTPTTPTVPTDGRTIPYPERLERGGAAGYDHSNDHLDSPYFQTGHDWYEQAPTDSLTLIPHFATYQQTTESNCGPASILMVLYHYGYKTVTEPEIAVTVETDDSVGTTVENLRDYFVNLGWHVNAHVSTDSAFADTDEFSAFVREQLQAGHPLIVNWTRWNGHWEVIIGIDTMGTQTSTDDVLIMADPYDTTDHHQDGYFVVGIEQFFYEWHEGLCAQKTQPYHHTYIIAYP